MKRFSLKKRYGLRKTLKKMVGGMFRSALRLTKNIGKEFVIDQTKRGTKKAINKIGKTSFEKKAPVFTYNLHTKKDNLTKKIYKINT